MHSSPLRDQRQSSRCSTSSTLQSSTSFCLLFCECHIFIHAFVMTSFTLIQHLFLISLSMCGLWVVKRLLNSTPKANVAERGKAPLFIVTANLAPEGTIAQTSCSKACDATLQFTWADPCIAPRPSSSKSPGFIVSLVPQFVRSIGCLCFQRRTTMCSTTSPNPA